eukprot:3198989-Amphidinium_carterae.1
MDLWRFANLHERPLLRRGLEPLYICWNVPAALLARLRHGPGSSANVEALPQRDPVVVPVAESLVERSHRHARERRWIYYQSGLRCPDDYPWQGLATVPA